MNDRNPRNPRGTAGPELPHAAATLASSVLGRLPRYPGSLLFATAVNLMLRRRLPADIQAAMEGKTFCIQVRDAALRFEFAWSGRAFVARRALAQPDLTISASAADFLLLAQRREDPDTLFFSRRLTMEGDTELGLLVKNTIDAVGPELIDLSRLAPARLLEQAAARLTGGRTAHRNMPH